MPCLRKYCSLCEKQDLFKLSHHLADYPHFSTKDRHLYFIQAKTFPLDVSSILKKVITLRQNARIMRRTRYK